MTKTAQAADAVRLYVAGASTREAAAMTGINARAVAAHVKLAGHILRPGPLPIRHPRNVARVKNLVGAGVSYSDIAKMLRVAPTTVVELARMTGQGCTE